MTGVLFEHPEWLGVCAALVASIIAATLLAQALARRRLRVLLGAFGKLRAGSIRDDLLLLAALALGALALVGPRIGERSVLVSTRGADVVLLLDVSKSMDARDVAPSRIGRARQAAAELLERLEPEDRAALAAFAGRGVLLTPLTPDAAALREMLPALDTSLIRPAASDLAAGVGAALEAFEAASDRPRVLVLLSDGESADRETSELATAAVRANTRVLAAALGSEAGGTIPSEGDELRDSTGRVVVTRRRTEPLELLAEASGGRLFRADEWGRFDLDELAREIGRDARGQPGELVERRVSAPMVLPFVAIAFALLLIELLPGAALGKLRALMPAGSTPRQRSAALALVVLFCFAPRSGPAAPELESEAAELDEAPAAQPQDVAAALEAVARTRALSARELLILGLARARSDSWDEAENSFLAAAMLSGAGDTAAIAYHDLGVAALRRGELERARTLFFDSLAMRPGDLETRFNLEWTIAALDVKPPEAPPEPRQSPEPEPEAPESSDDATPAPSEIAQDADAKAPAAGPSEAGEAGNPGRQQPPKLSDAQRERWIERIEDDPAKALQSAARDSGEPRSGRGRDAPAW